jgi:hypothetical protein
VDLTRCRPHDLASLVSVRNRNLDGSPTASRAGDSGSGDPSEHSSDKADHRRAFNGLVRGIVQASKTAGSIKVTASAPGLQSSTVELITEAVLLLEA